MTNSKDENGEKEAYSIIGKAGLGLEDQLKLVDWHCRKIGEMRRREELLGEPIQEEIDRLQVCLSTIRDQAEQNAGFHESAIAIWVEDSCAREKVGKMITLAHGTIKTRLVAGTTEIDNELLLRLASEESELYADVVSLAVNAAAVRKRFIVQEDGDLLDKNTGELTPLGIIRQITPPSVKVSVETHAGLPGEEDAEGNEA